MKGSYRYVVRSVTGTRKDADEGALAALVTELNSGVGIVGSTNATVAELVEQWLDLKRETLSVTTREGYPGKARFRSGPPGCCGPQVDPFETSTPSTGLWAARRSTPPRRSRSRIRSSQPSPRNSSTGPPGSVGTEAALRRMVAALIISAWKGPGAPDGASRLRWPRRGSLTG